MTDPRCTRTFSVTLLLVAIMLSPLAALADQRLDPNVSPTSQAIELDINADKTKYTGKVLIELEVGSATSTFQFHAEEMNLDRVELTGVDGAIGVEIELGERGLRSATAEREIKPGNYTLEIEFSKEFNTQALGLYRMTHEGKGYLFTQFEAVDARKAFPCWDEPIYKIPFQMSLTIPMQHNVVTNTPLEREIMGASTRTKVFAQTKPLPTYLLAIAAGPLESVAIPGLSVPGRIYTVKGQKHLAKLAAEVTPPILDALEEYFGRPYPYEKLDLIAIPEYWPGAMENAGAVTYRDAILLIDEDAASVAQKRTLARVTAHELAHMWFGDLVTMAWWDDLWLNESFADWLGDKITNQLFPQYMLEISELASVQNTMKSDARPSTTAIRKPVVSPADIMEDLGLAYNKGKTILRMIEMWIGEEAFQTGVRSYINENAWGNTIALDLFNALSEASSIDLQPMLSSFLDQPGFPVVGVEVKQRGVITISQKRFTNHGVQADPQMWTVPVRVKYSNGSDILTRTVILDDESTQMEVGGEVEWVMPDAGSYGYYRWNVPKDMLLKMAADPQKTLNQRERAAFLSNAKALLNAGELGGDDYLSMMNSFGAYPHPEIVAAVMSDLGDLRLAFVTDDLEDAYARYVRQTLRPALDHYGLEAREGEAEAVGLLRPRLIGWLGNYGRDEEVRGHCRAIAEAYMNDPKSTDASLAGVALRVAAIDGDQAAYDRFKSLFETAEVPADRSRYLSAMGRFHDPKIQDQAMEYVFSGKVRPNEMFQLVGGLGGTSHGRDKLFRWMTKNYQRITSMIPPEIAAYMPYFVSGCSTERLSAARAFFEQPEHRVDGTANNLKKVADQIMDCVNLREREGKLVADYFRELAAK